MSHKNPIHEALYRQVVRPALTKRKQAVDGTVMHVNYEEQTVRVYWRDPDSGAERESHDVPLPVDGDGVYKQSVEPGDMVSLSFRNGNHNNPYVMTVHKKVRPISYRADNGAGIPKGMGYL